MIYFAECRDCDWNSGHKKKEGKAERAAQKHYETTGHRIEILGAISRPVHEVKRPMV